MSEKWDAPFHKRAPLTTALIAASIVVALLTDLGEKWSAVQHLTISVQTIDPEGFVVDQGLQNVRRGELWRLITPIFLHFGLPHLFFNMLALMMFGDLIETRKGTRRLALIVLVSAVASNLGQFFGEGGNFGGMSGVDFAPGGLSLGQGARRPRGRPGARLAERRPDDRLALAGRDRVAGRKRSGGRQIPRMANIAHGVGLAVGMGFGVLRF